MVRTLKGHTGHVYGVSISPDGRLLASASGDMTIRLWNLETAELIRTLTGHSSGFTGGLFIRWPTFLLLDQAI